MSAPIGRVALIFLPFPLPPPLFVTRPFASFFHHPLDVQGKISMIVIHRFSMHIKKEK